MVKTGILTVVAAAVVDDNDSSMYKRKKLTGLYIFSSIITCIMSMDSQ